MDFVPFENAEQFTPRIVEMAQIAAREVHKQREHFQSFDKIYRYLLDNSHHDSWPKYDAAIEAALAGDFASRVNYSITWLRGRRMDTNGRRN
jgi:hypothetical protein